ncbi:hypothetical protein JOC45_003952 [Gordonia hydrophobica]|nr:hypothetical protein [Gordonia hydrophobica]
MGRVDALRSGVGAHNFREYRFRSVGIDGVRERYMLWGPPGTFSSEPASTRNCWPVT